MRAVLLVGIPLILLLACLAFAAPRIQAGLFTPSPVPQAAQQAAQTEADAQPEAQVQSDAQPESYAATAVLPGPEDEPYLDSSSQESRKPSQSRGYLTTPKELKTIATKARRGIEPYKSSVKLVLEYANRKWDFRMQANTDCPSSDDPAWIDDQGGIPELYGKALAYHLTGDEQYASEVKDILEEIMVKVKTVSVSDQQCRLNFSWGTPELVASADLIETYWTGLQCEGPASSKYGENAQTTGPCKRLFQNWLVKNPYYVISYSAERAQSNWGAAATNATAYIADYLWDRKDIKLIARTGKLDPREAEIQLTPGEAFTLANRQALDRMNGLRVEYDSSHSCDVLAGRQQSDAFAPVKSQITESGIIPEDARRDEYCNISVYDSEYQNYPQVHLGNNIQQCELMLRRGDPSCYDNVSQDEIVDYEYVGPDGKVHSTDLRKGRGSVERAIKAIIVDAKMEWRKDSALEVAYRYYFNHHTLSGFDQWFEQLDRPGRCSQDICFGTLTHGFAAGEKPQAPPVVKPPL